MERRKILIVEDDPKSRYALNAVLQDLGHAVVACNSAEDATQHNGHAFDVAIIDVRLPQEQGPQFAKKFLEQNPNCRVVFVTAYNNISAVKEGVPGAIVMVKPINLESLVKLL